MSWLIILISVMCGVLGLFADPVKAAVDGLGPFFIFTLTFIVLALVDIAHKLHRIAQHLARQ